jgi:hypothetical protein
MCRIDLLILASETAAVGEMTRMRNRSSDQASAGATIMKKTKTGATEAKASGSPAALIDARIAELGDWRGATLARVRALIKEADPDVVEEVKWRKPSNSVLTFARGAALPDPSRLFNSSLEGGTRRAIDIREGDRIDEKALKALVRAAVALNMAE